jgi:hypothetical protein
MNKMQSVKLKRFMQQQFYRTDDLSLKILMAWGIILVYRRTNLGKAEGS